MKYYLFFALTYLTFVRTSYTQSAANFNIPDTVCVNQNIAIQNTSVGCSSYYWNFCSGNLTTTPIGINMGNLGTLNRPVYSSIVKDSNNYYVFITNNYDGTLTRLSFGNSLINTPVATNLGTLGILSIYTEGIQIKKDSVSGNWIGLIAWGQTNCIARLNFGNSLANTPTVTNLGNIGNTLNLAHCLYLFQENNNWYGIVDNSYSNTIVRLNFGSSLLNTPTATNLGNIGNLNCPVGFFPIINNGSWHLFITNRNNNSISRLDFGSSLLNIPTGVNLGNISNTFNMPRSISILRDCGQVFGFVVNETTNDIVRLTFPSGLLNTPTGVSLGNIANFSFPHHISELFRVGDSLYTFIMNVNNNTISRLCFPNCNNSSVPSSNLQNPPVYSYNSPGTYNVSLVVDEGLPTQSNICKEVVVVEPTIPLITGDTTICVGDSLILNSTAAIGCTYQWTGPNGFISTIQNVIIPNANTNNAGTYTLTVIKNGCTSPPISKIVSIGIKPIVNLGNDTIVPCTSQSIFINLDAANSGCSYLWNTGQTSQTINVTSAGTYSVKVISNNGCFSSDTITIAIIPSVADFNIPDTVCINQNITIQNTTTCGSSYYWNFCSGNINTTPQAINLGNIGLFSGPVYTEIVKDGANYYVFVTNNSGGTLSRLFYGNNLLNIPVATNLGNFGGVIPVSIEDIHIENDNGTWYGIAVGGVGGNSRIIRLNFGNSLANIPTAVNMGNIGGMNYPQKMQIFKSGGNWYGFTVSRDGNTITRFSFGNSIGNTPTGTNLGNIGQLNIPDDISLIFINNNWYGYIINEGSNTITRLDFGNSLLNIPVATNTGNPGSLNGPRGISVFTDCNNIVGLVVNRYSNDLISLSFPSGAIGPIIGTSVGNIANFSFPHSIERFRVGDTLYAFIPNVNNNTLSRIYFPSCNNSSIASSNLQNPPIYSYNSSGTYNVSLVVNEGLPTQSNICKEVVVVGLTTPLITGDTTICVGDSLILNSTAAIGCTYQWTGPNGFTSTNQNIIVPNINANNAGTYTLTVTKNGCTSPPISKTVSTGIKPMVNLGNDTTFCQGNNVILNAGNTGCTYLWSTGQITQTINVTTSGTYWVKVTNGSGCYVSDTIIVNTLALPVVNLGNDTIICQGNNVTVNAGNSGCTYLWSTGQITQTINVITSGAYWVKVTNSSGCYSSDTIIVNFATNLTVNLGNDTSICQGDELLLNAGNTGSNYQWNTGANTQTISIQNSGNYWVQVDNNNCYGSDSINISVIPQPIISLGNDTIMCPGDLIILTPGVGFSQYLWSDGSGLSHLNVSSPGNYSVTVFDGLCSANDAIFIDECSSEIWIPNVFTPNGDDINEFFAPVYTNIDKITLYIYNRWGNKLYEGFGKSAVWDGKYLGKPCADGVYYYLIEYEHKGINKGIRELHGSVTLLR